MAIKLASLKADLAREDKGDWVAFPDWPGVEFNVSSLQKSAFVTARDLMIKKLARKHMGGQIPVEELAVENGRLFCDHILHDWRGLDEAYSPEKARAVLCDIAYREVQRAVEWCASKLSELHVEFVENAAKN